MAVYYGSCCYAECPNTYSVDSAAPFLKFPIDGLRRKEWIDNCGNPELTNLADRQLRGKRVCANHFHISSFLDPVTREELIEGAVPFLYQASDEPKPKPASSNKEVEEVQEVPSQSTIPDPVVKRGRGRPPRTQVVNNEVEEVEGNPPVKKPRAMEDKEEETSEPITRGRSLRVSLRKEALAEMFKRVAVKTLTPAVQVSEESSGAKETKATTTIVKRGRGRPPTKHLATIKKDSAENRRSLKETQVESSEDEQKDKATQKEDEPKSIENFLVDLKASCLLPDKGWSLSGILWEAGRKKKLIAVSEMDVTTGGYMRVKKCIKIYDDMTYRVLLEDEDMTTHFKLSKVNGVRDVNQLLMSAASAKLCTGLKNFETSDSNYFPESIQRGHVWFSSSCSVIVDTTGHVCSFCCRLRGCVRRRKIREETELKTRLKRKPLVSVTNKFGQALYSFLSDLMTDKKPSSVRPSVFKMSTNSTESVQGQGLNEMTKIELPILFDYSADMPSSLLGKRLKAKSGQNELGKGNSRSSKVNRRRNEVVSSEGMTGTLGQFVTFDGGNGNLILQQSGAAEFTLIEGQEYELIGVADAIQPIQSDNIEIVEVDEGTVAKLTGHGGNDMFFQDSENILVSEIDPDNLVKIIDPSSQDLTFD